MDGRKRHLPHDQADGHRPYQSEVADQEASKRLYRDVLGFLIAEEGPDHGGVFVTLGENVHTLDIGQHPSPEDAPRPPRGQIGLAPIAFQVDSYAALRDAYSQVESGVELMRAANHVSRRSFYFADPDRNVLEIYYELPYALELFPNGRSGEDEALAVSAPDDPLPQWLLEDWPGPEMKARIEQLDRRKESALARALRLRGGQRQTHVGETCGCCH